jgi:hypothetical protein
MCRIDFFYGKALNFLKCCEGRSEGSLVLEPYSYGTGNTGHMFTASFRKVYLNIVSRIARVLGE